MQKFKLLQGILRFHSFKNSVHSVWCQPIACKTTWI